MEASTKITARTRNPEYLVYRVGEDGMLTPVIKSPVKASSRKAAIVHATKSLPGNELAGKFLVIPAGQARVIERKTRAQVIDEFS